MNGGDDASMEDSLCRFGKQVSLKFRQHRGPRYLFRPPQLLAISEAFPPQFLRLGGLALSTGNKNERATDHHGQSRTYDLGISEPSDDLEMRGT